MNEPDPVLAYMKHKDIPITRDNYIALAYMDMIPDPWTEEDEESLPVVFRENISENGVF